ncbi:uncharacterized protein LOC121377956 [Gigantopelta aegis]|uniref:uncharacterized protein LOC121377956 n=1 Tax=Gigantopelta aegis TaxID=1735272 RepID=UPI001B88AF46|nr:uncharacterized protein LOC121377956 [Gigantopelta aegis]
MTSTRRIPVAEILKIIVVVIATVLVEHVVLFNTRARYSLFSDETLIREVNDRKLKFDYKHASAVVVKQDRAISTGWNVNTKEESFPAGQTPIYRWDGSGWNMEHDFCKWTDLPQCVMLNTTAGQTPIYLNDLKRDYWLSARLSKKQGWESEHIQLVLDEMKHDPEIGFLDIGSHIGIYTINIAKTGRKVIAVDILVGNLLRLCKSIQKGELTKNVILFFNPLADGHQVMTFRDQGTSAFPEKNKNPASASVSPCKESMSFHTATLDDVLPFMTFRRAFIKMDVESFEYKVVKGGRRFFSEIDVKGILMEWVLQKNAEGKRLVDEMLQLNYVPYNPDGSNNELNTKNHTSWPHDVLWRKRQQK